MPQWFAREYWQIVDDSLRLCGDFRGVQKNGRLWSRAEVRSVANEKMLELVKLSGALKTVRTIPLQDGVNVYDLPDDCVMPLRVGLHGMEGTVVFHRSITDVDMTGGIRSAEGYPETLYREFLAPHQIGFMPIPSEDGSSTTRDSDYGLLRDIHDADGYVLFDDNVPVRRIRGVPCIRSGGGTIIREVTGTYGNIQIYYIRAPKLMGENEFEYPDEAIPEIIHHRIRYGVAFELLKGMKKRVHRDKQSIFGRAWIAAVSRLQRIVECKGPMNDARPL